jgi:adenylylsulfate kinase-like enzyme
MLRRLQHLTSRNVVYCAKRNYVRRAQPLQLVLLGLPGSGKGTQAKWMVRDFNLRVLSTGDMLR